MTPDFRISSHMYVAPPVKPYWSMQFGQSFVKRYICQLNQQQDTLLYMKSKYVAAALAFFLGIFGVHRFYLGKRFLGILYFLLFMFTFAVTVEEGFPAIMFPALLGFIDAVLLFVMPPEEFDERYNSKYMKRQQGGNWIEPPVKRQAPVRAPRQGQKKRGPEVVMDYKKAGIEAFRSHDYDNAIEAFEQALDLRFEDPALHFNLACCYSLMEDEQKAYYHLEHAVAFGFNDKGKIHDHDALAFLRSRKDFDAFEKNGYRRPEEQPAPLAAKPEPVAMPNEADTGLEQLDLLEQISQLGKLRDLGVLTEEEFAEQKQKLLRI